MGSDFGDDVRQMNKDLKTIGDSAKEIGDRCYEYKYAREYAKGKQGDYLENYYKGLKEAEKRRNENI